MNITPEQAWTILERADVVASAEAVGAAVDRVATAITDDLARELPLVLSVMRGSVVFAGQLLPQLRFPLDFDYLDVTRYGNTTAGGAITWHVTPGTSVAGRVVLVLDDILDEGETLAHVKQRLLDMGAAQVLLVVFADKDIGKAKPAVPDMVGLVLPNKFVIGYGMVAYGYWRNLPEIRAIPL